MWPPACSRPEDETGLNRVDTGCLCAWVADVSVDIFSLLVPGLPPTPVQLLYPVSRFSNVKSLQHLCRFCIRQIVRIDHIQELPLPRYLMLIASVTVGKVQSDVELNRSNYFSPCSILMWDEFCWLLNRLMFYVAPLTLEGSRCSYQTSCTKAWLLVFASFQTANLLPE